MRPLHHHHAHDHIRDEQGRVIPLGIHLLAKNDQLATENRAWFAEQDHVLNWSALPVQAKPLSWKKPIRFEENYRS